MRRRHGTRGGGRTETGDRVRQTRGRHVVTGRKRRVHFRLPVSQLFAQSVFGLHRRLGHRLLLGPPPIQLRLEADRKLVPGVKRQQRSSSIKPGKESSTIQMEKHDLCFGVHWKCLAVSRACVQSALGSFLSLLSSLSLACRVSISSSGAYVWERI